MLPRHARLPRLWWARHGMLSGQGRLAGAFTGLCRLAGRSTKYRVEDAKDWLRTESPQEGRKLASRLSNLSRLRNGQSHVDTMLLDKVSALLKQRAKLATVGPLYVWEPWAGQAKGAQLGHLQGRTGRRQARGDGDGDRATGAQC